MCNSEFKMSSVSSLSSFSDEEGPTSRVNEEKLNAMEKYNETEFKRRFRLSKDTVLYLESVFGQNVQPLTKRNRAIQPVDQILIALRYYATGSYQRVIGDIFHVEQPTVHRIVHRITAEIAKLSPLYISMPMTAQERHAVADSFYAIADFPRVLGAVDCTHIKINSPGTYSQ